MPKEIVFYAREKRDVVIAAEKIGDEPRFTTKAGFYRALAQFSATEGQELSESAFKTPFTSTPEIDANGLPYSEFSESVNGIICSYLGLKKQKSAWLTGSEEQLLAALQSQSAVNMARYGVEEGIPEQPLRRLASISVMMDPQVSPPVYEAEGFTPILASIRLGVTDHFAHEARISVALKQVSVELEFCNGSKIRRPVGLEKSWDTSGLSGNPTFSTSGQPPVVGYSFDATEGTLRGVIEPILGELNQAKAGEVVTATLKTRILDVADISEEEALQFDGIADGDGQPITSHARSRILARLAAMELFGSEDMEDGEVKLASHEIKLVKSDEQ